MNKLARQKEETQFAVSILTYSRLRAIKFDSRLRIVSRGGPYSRWICWTPPRGAASLREQNGHTKDKANHCADLTKRSRQWLLRCNT